MSAKNYTEQCDEVKELIEDEVMYMVYYFNEGMVLINATDINKNSTL